MVVAVSLGSLKEEILTLFFNKSSMVILLCVLCSMLFHFVYVFVLACLFLLFFYVSFFSYLCIVLLRVYEWQIEQH